MGTVRLIFHANHLSSSIWISNFDKRRAFRVFEKERLESSKFLANFKLLIHTNDLLSSSISSEFRISIIW